MSDKNRILNLLGRYFFAVSLVAVTTLINAFLVGFTGYWTVALIYLLVVMIFAIFNDFGPVLLLSLLCALTWNFLFIPPVKTFRIGRIEDVTMFLVFMMTAVIMGLLTSRFHSHEKKLILRESNLNSLYELSKKFSVCTGIDESRAVLTESLNNRFGADFAVELFDDLTFAPDIGTFSPQEFPLVYRGKLLGRLVTGRIDEAFRTQSRLRELEGILSLFYMALERERLREIKNRSKLLEDSENLSRILLQSVSHEFRTPLTTITGAASGLLDDRINSSDSNRRALAAEIHEAGERLNRLVENLLDLSRLESGMLRLNRQMYDMDDLLGVVFRKYGRELSGYPLVCRIPDDLPMIPVDGSLMEQVFSNLLHNAINHNPVGTAISVTCTVDPEYLHVSFADNGVGIPDQSREDIFRKFMKTNKSGPAGLGLGLSICKGIVEAHKGRIALKKNEPAGTVMVVSLPLGEKA